MSQIKDENIMQLLKQLHLRIDHFANSAMASSGLTGAQCHILGYLLAHQNKDIYSSEIHAKLYLSRATVSGLLKKLRNKGFLRFETEPSDDRLKRIILTDQAKELEENMVRSFAYVEDFLYKDFSEEEKEHAETLLKKMLANSRKLPQVKSEDAIYEWEFEKYDD